MAIKSTAGYIDGKEVHVFKDPKTDNGMKKSAKGYLVVECNEWGDLVLVDGLTKAESSYGGLLKTVFRNGAMDVVDLKSIRDRIDYSVKVMADKGT
jgi:nicotinamide phosphoribosyltransferase